MGPLLHPACSARLVNLLFLYKQELSSMWKHDRKEDKHIHQADFFQAVTCLSLSFYLTPVDIKTTNTESKYIKHEMRSVRVSSVLQCVCICVVG